jgi:glycogen operon protein
MPSGARGFAFGVHAKAKRKVEVSLHRVGGARAFRRVALERDPDSPDGFEIWRGELAGLDERFEYAVRVDGGPPLLDPYAPCLSGGEEWGRSDSAIAPGVGRRYRGLWIPEAVSRAGVPVSRPSIAEADRVVYELHVRGFTRHPSSGVSAPGTYRGLVEKIPYLKSLGVTSVELLPVFEFDETENFRSNPATGERLLNFWGYSPVSFFAPKAGYAASREPGAAAIELREAVDELHRAGIEVLLDVVYNHTAEGRGGARDPRHSFRALDPRGYYLHHPGDGSPVDVTGCGNTVAANHPVARRLIVDSLVHWAAVYGVDGFRFDLAAFFFRGAGGAILERPPVLEEIAREPALAGRRLIAEPWDVTGFTPGGGFPPPWAEWNGRFRDDARRLWRGDPVASRTVALRLAGSPDRFAAPRSRFDAIDFVACHDGHPLADLVAYEDKHNESNGEGNADGANHDFSFNCGVEGATDDPAILALRERQVRNLLATLFATAGTPMLLAGDERGRSQAGNNNAWCQDNEVGWVDWGVGTEPERVELVRRGFALHRELAAISRDEVARLSPFATAERRAGATMALFRGPSAGRACAVAVNPTGEPVRFPLPAAPDRAAWRLALDSARPGLAGIPDPAARPGFDPATSEVELAPCSVRILTAGFPG